MQGKDNNYDIDAFTPIMSRIQQLAGHTDAQRQAHLHRYRDCRPQRPRLHFYDRQRRAAPGNESSQYVLRMILRTRRASAKSSGFDRPLALVADSVIQEMGGHYTDLLPKREYILQTITDEESICIARWSRGCASSTS